MLICNYKRLDNSVKSPVRVWDKVVGYLQNGIFNKSVMGSKHQLKYPPAWAIDADAFDQEVRPNATEIIVIDKETGSKYHASVETFDRLKGEIDRGFGRQYYLTLNNWHVEDNGNRQLNFFELVEGLNAHS